MRIVSLAPSATEILFAIGAGSYIVANTAYCDYPEEAKKIPKVGSWIYIDDKKIKQFKPDLVITSTIVQHQSNKRYKQFKHIHLDPRSLNDIYSNILLLGKTVMHENNAQLVVRKMKNMKQVLLKTKYSHKPKIYIEEWFNPPMASGNWVPDVVNIAGGTYFPGIKNGDVSRAIDDKEIHVFNPDIIFVSYCGYKNKSDTQKIIKRKTWQSIIAVKNNRVFAINDDYLNRPGPRILLAAQQMQTYFTLL